MSKRFFLPVFSVILIIFAFIIDGSAIFDNFFELLKSPSVLTTDYLHYGFGATLLNVSLLIMMNLLLLKILNLRVTGPILAGLLTIAGCGFYGKNVLNTIPIYLGIYLYTLINKSHFRNNIIAILFSSGISPIVSFMMFGLNLNYGISIPLGFFVGIVVGFLIPSISGHSVKFHNGYNLYNMGFALGIIAILFNGLVTSFNINVTHNQIQTTEYHNHLLILLGVVILTFLIAGFILSRKELKRYRELLKRSGRLVTDFVRDYGVGITMINMAIMGIICLIVVFVLRLTLNGPMIGSIITVIGFSSFGIHPKNSWMLILSSIVGCFLIYYVTGNTINPVVLFLVLGLAPIAGRYGIIVAFITGFMHTMIVTICADFQGGFDLYNNGFAAGFIAAIIAPLIDSIRSEE